VTAPGGGSTSSGAPDPSVRPPWWPEDEAWPPPEQPRRWAGPPDWEARRREWRARRMRYGGGRYGGMRRGFGCLITLMATLVVSIGVLVLWLLGGLLGLSTNEGFLASLARPAGLVVLVVGIIALVIGIRIARSVVAPLSELIDAAGRIEAADYSVRVGEPTGGRGELRGLTRAFNEMAARLEAEDATRRRLLADVSHELRTPLAVIQGNLEALLDGVYPPDEAHIGPIVEEVRVMERLVDDLRTLSLAEAGALPLHREPTDPAILLEDVAAGHRARADAASVAINVAVRGTLPMVDVDPVRIRQVVSNLVDNAIRAIAAAGPTGGTITLSAGVADGRLSIEVADDGPGIPSELLGSVFDRFTKSAESRGSGLGLSIARAIVTAHGGTITAESTSGQHGTAIRISLPLG
jgi:two-component system sensor histidine kinase BaeS